MPVSITVYSPALTLLFVWALLWMMMDIHFRDLTPVQKWLVPLLILLLAVGNDALRAYLGSAAYARTIMMTMHLPFYLIFLSITHCGKVKMLFMILSALVFTAPTVVISNFVRAVLADTPAALLISNVLAYAAMLALTWFVFRRGFNYLLRYGSSSLFALFSIVPILYYAYVFAVICVDFTGLTSPAWLLVRYLPTVQVFLFYFLLLHNYRSLSEKRELETAQAALGQKLAAAEQHISLLNRSQTQTAVYQHDMRHHLTMLRTMLEAGKPDQAEAYICKVQADIAAITPKRWCENETVNLLCSAFADKAERAGIRLKIDAKLPKTLTIADTELCSLLSNGLENALRAAGQNPDPYRRVSLYCAERLGKLLIEIKNPCFTPVPMHNGLPAADREGHGYGCRSMQTIVEKNKGICSFTAANDEFCVKILVQN